MNADTKNDDDDDDDNDEKSFNCLSYFLYITLAFEFVFDSIY